MRVWDRLVRLLHWTLVGSIALAWLSTLGLGIVKWHEPAGYVALAVVASRIAWGFAGGHYARFTQFVRGASATARYAREVAAGHEPRYIGHNPLGGWMVVALLLCVAATATTGWLYTTDMFWGEEWLDQLHQALAWAVLVLASVHVGGVVFTSIRHQENLVSAMFTGNKRPAGGDDVA